MPDLFDLSPFHLREADNEISLILWAITKTPHDSLKGWLKFIGMVKKGVFYQHMGKKFSELFLN